MNIRQLAALVRRHIIAAGLILVVTAGIAIDFKLTPSPYTETATVALEPENFNSIEPLSVDSDYLQNTSLIATCQVLVMLVSGPQGEAQLRKAGVTSKFMLSLVNESNIDDPSYDYPQLLVSATSGDPDSTHRQFSEAMQVIAADIARLQTGYPFSEKYRIKTYMLSDSGPVSQRGSLVRSYAALVFLALIATFLMCSLLDRRSNRDLRINRPIKSAFNPTQ